MREGGKQLDRKHAYAGGRELPKYGDAGAVVVSRNITPHPEAGIGQWSDAEIKRATVTGTRPDGTQLSPVMPFDWYRKMTPADLDALVAYLRTVEPVPEPSYSEARNASAVTGY